MSVDQVLNKLFQIGPKLTFDTFHILNDGRISKIEKNIRWSRPVSATAGCKWLQNQSAF